MSVRIIIDSTADMPKELKNRCHVVPLTVHFGDTEYIDGVTIDHKTFYEMLVESDTLPSTSQATPAAFSQLFEEVTGAGDTAVVITLSSYLSGTYQSAMIAAADFEEKIYVVDSQTVAIGTGILAELALQLADAGMDAKSLAETITQQRENVRVVALLDTLEYLKRGGRISKTVAFAGGLLSIKPVVCVDKGEIKVLGKARGSRQGNNLLAREIANAGGIDFTKPVLLGYTGLSDMLLKKYKQDSSAFWEGRIKELPTAVVGSVVGTHAGPGAIAVAFFSMD